MKLTTSSMLVKYFAAATPQVVSAHPRHSTAFLHLLFSFGLFGLFFVSIVDSSFVPLPVPGVTDIMILLLAARHNWLWPVLIATAGSALGGLTIVGWYEVSGRSGTGYNITASSAAT